MKIHNDFKIRLFSTIPGLLFFIATFYSYAFHKWSFLGLVPQNVNFGDARVITTAALCATTDSNWNPLNSNCESYGFYNYPRYWAQLFAKLGLTTDQTDLVGVAFLALLAISITLICFQSLRHRFSWFTISYFTLMALSPPIILLAERGNNDSLIFFLVTIASLTVISGKGILSTVFFTIAGVLKIYPFGGILGIFSSKKNLWLRLSLFTVLSAFGLLFILPEIALVTSKTPQSNYASFGSKLIPFQLLGPDATTVMPKKLIAFGVIVFCFAFLLIWLFLRLNKTKRITFEFKELIDELDNFPLLAGSFVAGIGVFIFTYLLGISWDYRLVYLFIPVGSLLAVTKSHLSKWLLGLIMLEMYFTYLSGDLNQAIGDWIWLLLAPVLFIISIELISKRTSVYLLSSLGEKR